MLGRSQGIAKLVPWPEVPDLRDGFSLYCKRRLHISLRELLVCRSSLYRAHHEANVVMRGCNLLLKSQNIARKDNIALAPLDA